MGEAYRVIVEAVHGELGSLACTHECKPSCLALYSEKPSIVVTPSYHYTLSRALAALAVRDRDSVEWFAGVLIYTGGDDILAFLPPVGGFLAGSAGRGGRLLDYPVLGAALETRKSYEGSEGGFNVLGGIAVPGIRPFGRSYSIYYAKVKTPLWLTLRTSHELLELKDRLAALAVNGRGFYVSAVKDSAIVASEAKGPGVVPNKAGSSWGLEELQRLLRELAGGTYSTSLLYDVLTSYATLINEAASRPQSLVVAKKMIEAVEKRNTPRGKRPGTSLSNYGGVGVLVAEDPGGHALELSSRSVRAAPARVSTWPEPCDFNAYHYMIQLVLAASVVWGAR
jgi:CRISPR-associated protein Cmr2